MRRGQEKNVVYAGEIRIIPFHPEHIDEAEEALKGFMELEEGEKLYVNPKKGCLSVSIVPEPYRGDSLLSMRIYFKYIL